MNCPNCGNPMKLILEKRQFVCNHCTKSYFPKYSSDGVSIIDGPCQGQCPTCRRHQLVFATIVNKTVLYCQECNGFLLPIRELMPIIQALRTQRTTFSDVAIPRLAESRIKGTIHCPVCQAAMEPHLYGSCENIVVDSCVECGVIWIDKYELDHIVAGGIQQSRVGYKTMWVHKGIRRYNDDLDLWSMPSVLTSNLDRILERLF